MSDTKRPSQTRTEGQSQIDKFRDVARELGCDESEERFDARLERIAKVPPPKDEVAEKDKPGR